MDGTIDLGDRIEAFTAELVTEGRYPSGKSIPRESMRLFEERERRLARVDEAVNRGLADVEAGRVKPATEVFDRFLKKYADQARAKGE